MRKCCLAFWMAERRFQKRKLHNRPILDEGKIPKISGRNIVKLFEIENFVVKCCKLLPENIASQNL